jgi:serine/threonine protein phosphatase PrpC
MNRNSIPPISAPVSLKWSGRTDRGKVRPNNEDAFLGLRFDAREIDRLGKTGAASMESMDFAFAVSDGMGGAKAGEHASRIAIEKITTLLPRSFQQAATGLEIGFEDVLMELFDQTHRALQYLGASDEECTGMETTLSLCWFTPGWVYFGHIGDSRIYHLPARKRRIQQLSHDDTHVGWLFRNGKISEREARTHPRRNALQKALGGGNQFVDPQVGAVAYQAGDTFLLCTDGLVEGLPNRQLVELLHPKEPDRTVSDLAHLLVEESLNRDGRDNTTALVVQVI